MNEPWCNDVSSYRARLLEMVTPDQLPFADFELRMLLTTLETDHLRDIHTNWRPIADERNKLRAELIEQAKPISEPAPRRSRALAAAQADPQLQVRFDALSFEFKTIQRNHANLHERHQKLHEEYGELEAKYKALQIACGEVEA